MNAATTPGCAALTRATTSTSTSSTPIPTPGPATPRLKSRYLVDGLEPVRLAILPHLPRIPDASVHRDPHARIERLHGAHGAADVEHRVGTDEPGRVQRAGQHDDLVLDALE